MKIKTGLKRRVFEVFNVLFMIFMIVITLYPILYIVFASVSQSDRLINFSGILLRPLGFTLLAYEKAFEHPLIVSAYGNTLFIVVVGTCINLVLTAIGAYFLSAKDVMLQKPIALMIVFTMFFGGGMIPFYLTVKELGLYDTLWAIIIPAAINTFNLIVMRTGFAQLPESLSESARIDGAGHIRILFKIVIPLSMPTIAVILLYYGVSHWNAWFNASIFLRDSAKFPLQLVLRQILIVNNTDAMTQGVDLGEQLSISETIKYAVIVISTLPILCVYPFLQRYFVKGVMIGAVKG